MKGLREIAMTQLYDIGLLVSPEKRAIQETIYPWLIERIQDFLNEDEAI